MDAALAPVVAVPACRKFIAPHPFHAVGEKYLHALAAAAGAVPLIIPALGAQLDLRRIVGRVDGLMLTGSVSNVDPQRYGARASRSDTELDPERDATTFGLIETAIAMGMPILAICRGFQEVNVVLGGSLHQHVHELADRLDHRENEHLPTVEQYAPVHSVRLRRGGLLHKLAGADEVRVNSLHAQGVDRLAAGLTIEATASDGLVEGFRLARDTQYLLGVQWHPEWQVMENAFYRAIFHSFGEACRNFAASGQHETDSELA